MSKAILQLSPAPCEEPCAQVGHPDYPEQSSVECRVYRRMLARQRPIPSGCLESARVTVRSFPHDFGSYREVCVEYDPAVPAAVDYAFCLERALPAHWDAIARYELLWLQRREQYWRAVRRGDLAEGDIPAGYLAVEPPVLPEGRTLIELLAEFPQ